jgi:3-oxoacyl-[acyl-carrier protein] reductase
MMKTLAEVWGGLGVNSKGGSNRTKAVLPKMIEQKSESIINVSSIAGAPVDYSNLAHYFAYKAGTLDFTRAAALELAQYRIKMNAIAPGAIETPGTKALCEEPLKQIEQTVPLRRIGQLEDIANLVIFLASDESSYIIGQLISQTACSQFNNIDRVVTNLNIKNAR